MLSIGEFSNICRVSAKTLRYYAEIGLLTPSEVNKESGYRYYSVEQLETMLFINRLKAYQFSLEEIKTIMASEEMMEEKLYTALLRKKETLQKQADTLTQNISQINDDIQNLKKGIPIMSYLNDIDVQLTDVPPMYLLSIRKIVLQNDFPMEYRNCFSALFQRIQKDNLTICAPPMVLFHSDEFSPFGLDTEFAFPVREYVTGTRDFKARLCLKTTVHGSYSSLSSVYAKQIKWAEENDYECTNALFEVYVTDPSEVTCEKDLVTEVYYPIKKKNRKTK